MLVLDRSPPNIHRRTQLDSPNQTLRRSVSNIRAIGNILAYLLIRYDTWPAVKALDKRSRKSDTCNR